ncbi:MAG: penicillin-binding transpeptidase domain-containing protein [Deltaproteobacteria bacterium]|nr:penicillin-binding transpeptidase domain-containing protein [Deltaproteobacteria bacterium]
MIYKPSRPSKWQKYQASLQKASRRKHFLKRLPSLAVIAGLASVVVVILVFLGIGLTDELNKPRPQPPAAKEQDKKQAGRRPEPATALDLKAAIEGLARDSAKLGEPAILHANGRRYFISTAIHAKLQKYILKTLKRSRTQQSAVVVMDSHNGRLLAMVNYDANGDTDNLCLQANFPAASLFKIVTAAAALESAGLKPDQGYYYRGNKHTLYKSQLKTKKDRWTTQTSFRKAFAYSNNAVFGKIGIYDLGQDKLMRYSEKFFFNRPIASDLPVAVSRVTIPADDFGLAEIASGFNKETLISPMHAALLAAVAVNKGSMPAPRLVDSIRNDSNEVIYQASLPAMKTTVNRQTAQDLKLIMQDAVRYGTGRTAFRKLRRKKRFKKFDLGAKTGTINDREDRFKYDWVTAFATSPDGAGSICVSVLGVHGKILGTRSTEMTRAIVDYYFSTVGKKKP